MIWEISVDHRVVLKSGEYRIIDVGYDRVSYDLTYRGRGLASSSTTGRLQYLAMSHARNTSMSEHNKGKL